MRARVLNPINARHGHTYAPGELVDVLSTYKHSVAGPDFATIRDLDGRRWIPCVRIENLEMIDMADFPHDDMPGQTDRYPEKRDMAAHLAKQYGHPNSIEKRDEDKRHKPLVPRLTNDTDEALYAQLSDNMKRGASGGQVPHLEPGVKLDKPPLTLDTKDSNGYVPNRRLIGTTWRHTNGKIYRINGFEWNSESDQWMLACKCDDDPITCLRGLHNFFSANERGEKRYTEMSR
jgi:hypothetical protein